MVTAEQMTEAMVALMPPAAVLTDGSATDADVDREVKRILAEVGMDVDAVFGMAQSIVQMAVAAQQEPEQTVVGAFVTGCALMAVLYRRGALQ